MMQSLGLGALSQNYNTLFCDVWGVVHNGMHVHQTAIDALGKFRQQGGVVILVTNAPRPSKEIARDVLAMGVPEQSFDALVSSGQVTRDFIKPYAGEVIHRIGPHSDGGIFEGIDVEFGTAENAKAIICSDLGYGKTPKDYQYEVKDWKARGLPLICANPDKVVEVGDQLIYCGGALADVYQEAGGEVIMAGKPFAPIYQKAAQLAFEAGGIAQAEQKILAIGDSARTDATGAATISADLLFISGSIHAHELGALDTPDPQKIEQLLAPTKANCVGYSPRLIW